VPWQNLSNELAQFNRNPDQFLPKNRCSGKITVAVLPRSAPATSARAPAHLRLDANNNSCAYSLPEIQISDRATPPRGCPPARPVGRSARFLCNFHHRRDIALSRRSDLHRCLLLCEKVFIATYIIRFEFIHGNALPAGELAPAQPRHRFAAGIRDDISFHMM